MTDDTPARLRILARAAEARGPACSASACADPTNEAEQMTEEQMERIIIEAFKAVFRKIEEGKL